MRTKSITRKTTETDISITIDLDGTGLCDAFMPVGFFKHMLAQVARHGFLDLKINAIGDMDVDGHHTIEDIGIVLGQVLLQALGDKKGIRRYGNATVPMDDALATCAVDLSGRPYLHFDATFTTPKLGEMDTEMIKEFFQAIAVHAGMNLHITVPYGENNHHKAEAIFKAFGRALSQAIEIDPKVQGVLSTKGTI